MKFIINAIFVVSIMAILAGCGGAEPTSPPVAVTGMAAAGAPLVGTVILKDSSDASKQLTSAIGADGSFSLDVSGLTAPFLLQGAGTASGNNYTLYSLATNAGNCNINPLTNLAVTMANGGQDPVSIFVTPTSGQIAAISAALPVAMASIQEKLAPIFSRVGASSTSGNVMTDQFAATGQGVDLLFDMVSITVSNGSVSLVNRSDGAIILPPTSLSGGILGGTPNADMMSPLYTISGRLQSRIPVHVQACCKPPAELFGPTKEVKTDAEGNYTVLVPNGTYGVCSYSYAYGEYLCSIVTVNNANVGI